MKLCDELKRARLEENFTLEELAKATGLLVPILELYEKGEITPTVWRAQVIAKALSVPTDRFLALWVQENVDAEALEAWYLQRHREENADLEQALWQLRDWVKGNGSVGDAKTLMAKYGL